MLINISPFLSLINYSYRKEINISPCGHPSERGELGCGVGLSLPAGYNKSSKGQD